MIIMIIIYYHVFTSSPSLRQLRDLEKSIDGPKVLKSSQGNEHCSPEGGIICHAMMGSCRVEGQHGVYRDILPV